MKVSIGIFAHNEAENVSRILSEVDDQDVFEFIEDVSVIFLSNGSTDETACMAARELNSLTNRSAFRVLELRETGKSRTWNHFIHECCNETDIIVCIDADIHLPSRELVKRLAFRLTEYPDLHVTGSFPVKDITEKENLNLRQKLILRGAGTLDSQDHAICGQAYAIRGSVARNIHMPIGLPVEDGFLPAMVLTKLLTEEENPARIVNSSEIFHIYQSESELLSLLRHQIRIVLGGAVNAHIFADLNRTEKSFDERVAYLKRASQYPSHVADVVQKSTPRWPYGYVPLHFLFKRLQRLPSAPGISKKAMIVAGFGLDIVAYIGATVQMARKKSQGYW